MKSRRAEIGFGVTLALALLACAPLIAQSTQTPANQQPYTGQPAYPVYQGQGTAGGDPSVIAQTTFSDQSFVRQVLSHGAIQVQLGRLAQQKSQSEDVKQYGRQVIEVRTRVDERLKFLGDRLGLTNFTGPSKRGQALVAKLETLTGTQFDEEYIKANLMEYRRALHRFKMEARLSEDTNLQKAAEEGAESIEQGLGTIEMIAQAHKVTLEERKQ